MTPHVPPRTNNHLNTKFTCQTCWRLQIDDRVCPDTSDKCNWKLSVAKRRHLAAEIGILSEILKKTCEKSTENTTFTNIVVVGVRVTFNEIYLKV